MSNTNNNLLSLDAILSANDLEIREVNVPEWNGTVKMKTLTGKERDQYADELLNRQGEGGGSITKVSGLRSLLLVRVLIDVSGLRLFDTPEKIEKLDGKSSKVLDRLYDIAQEMNGIGEEEERELAGNLEGTKSGSTG